jgi:metal-responsive CopG/Arc/MetJ family transcriptional regulator
MNTQTLNIALPKDLVKKADELAKKEYRNRSELIREALRIYIERKSTWEEIFAIGEKAAKKAGIKNEDEINQLVSDFRHAKKTSNRS